MTPGRSLSAEDERLLDRAGRDARSRRRGTGTSCCPGRRGRGSPRRRPRPTRAQDTRRRPRGPAASSRPLLLRGCPRGPGRLRPAPGPPRPAPCRGPPGQRRSPPRGPASPPPTTSTSTWRCTFSNRPVRRWSGSSLPSPAALAQELLVVLPRPPRADERLVVEADLHPERGRGLPDSVQQRRLERRPGVDRVDLHALRRPASCRRARPARRRPGTRQFGHWPATHSRPRGRWYLNERENTRTPAAIQRRGDRVAREAGYLLALPAERDRPVRSIGLASSLGQPAASHRRPPTRRRRLPGSRRAASPPGWRTSITVLSRVSRSAWNHSRQPEEWNHHSRCVAGDVVAEVQVAEQRPFVLRRRRRGR